MPARLWAHPRPSFLLGIFSSLHRLSGFPGRRGQAEGAWEGQRENTEGLASPANIRPSRVGMELAENTHTEPGRGVGRPGWKGKQRTQTDILFCLSPLLI